MKLVFQKIHGILQLMLGIVVMIMVMFGDIVSLVLDVFY